MAFVEREPDVEIDGPPRYLQIADQIEAGIRSGTLKPGEVRWFALDGRTITLPSDKA